MYDPDYLCPDCYGRLTENEDGTLHCEFCDKDFEPWECANTFKAITEDYCEQRALDRFRGLED